MKRIALLFEGFEGYEECAVGGQAMIVAPDDSDSVPMIGT